MHPSRRVLLFSLLVSILVLITAVVASAESGPQLTRSSERVPVAERLAAITADLDRSAIPSGILHIPAIATDTLSGNALSPSNWYQAYLEMQRSVLDGSALAAPADVREAARTAARQDAIPLGVLHFEYQAVRPDAVENGLIIVDGDRLRDAPDRTESPYETHRLFAVAPLWEQVYAGMETTFALDDAFFFGNQPTPDALRIDLGDGSGVHELRFGDSVTVTYPEAGSAEITVTARFADGSEQTASANLEIRPSVPTEPDVSWENLVAALPYLGEAAVYDAYIFYADGHTQIEKPLIFAEGFDFENSISWPEVIAIVSEYGLVDSLLADGYDLIIMNFEDGTDYVQRNSFALVDLIERVKLEQVGDEPLVVGGASMGGIIGRYALAWMEQNSMDHDTRLLLTFDTPHQTANVPLGVQEWVAFFSGYNADAGFFLDALDAPAARQLLVYHHLSTPDPTQDALRAQMFADLAAVGNYPVEPRLVAIANGSGAGAAGGQTGNGGAPMLPGTQIVDWEYGIILVIDVTGNVWAVPDIAPQTQILEAAVDIFLFFGDSLNVYAEGTLPYDNAPGGFRPTQQQMSEFDPTYDFLGFVIELGDINTNFPNHAFVPTNSALDARDNQGNPLNLFYNFNGDNNALKRTPFDAIFFPTGANEEHVVVSAENAAFLLEQLAITTDVSGTIEPIGAPIVIPASGGSFQYDLMLQNNMNGVESADIKLEIRNSGGTTVRTLLQRTVNLQPAAAIARTRTQQISGVVPAGDYTLVFTVESDSGTTESSFPFTKLAP
ncbi:MAG: hypothetical protein M9965_14175 [Anaerolineae bacterium]|nr:hypothetical protein [Anaerolineae bacterium]